MRGGRNPGFSNVKGELVIQSEVGGLKRKSFREVYYNKNKTIIIITKQEITKLNQI